MTYAIAYNTRGWQSPGSFASAYSSAGWQPLLQPLTTPPNFLPGVDDVVTICIEPDAALPAEAAPASHLVARALICLQATAAPRAPRAARTAALSVCIDSPAPQTIPPAPARIRLLTSCAEPARAPSKLAAAGSVTVIGPNALGSEPGLPTGDTEDLALKFFDVAELTASASTVTLGLGGDGRDNADFADLITRKSDVVFECDFVLNDPGGGFEIDMRPNNRNEAATRHSWGLDDGAPFAMTANILHVIGGTLTGAILLGHCRCKFDLIARSDHRKWRVQQSGVWKKGFTGGGDDRLREIHGYYNEPAQTISTCVFNSSVANLFAAGTRITAYELQRE